MHGAHVNTLDLDTQYKAFSSVAPCILNLSHMACELDRSLCLIAEYYDPIPLLLKIGHLSSSFTSSLTFSLLVFGVCP